MKLKAFTAAILLKVVNILLHLARLSLKLADMIFKVLVLNAQCLYLLICRVKMFLHLFVLVGQELLALSNPLISSISWTRVLLFSTRVFDILSSLPLRFLTSTFVAGASMLLSSIQVEMNSIINQKPTEANQLNSIINQKPTEANQFRDSYLCAEIAKCMQR